MADEGQYSETYTSGPTIPAEALQQGSMNKNPNFEPNKGDEPSTDKVEFGIVEGGRQKFVKPGRYPMKSRRTKDLDGKVLTIKGLTRIDH